MNITSNTISSSNTSLVSFLDTSTQHIYTRPWHKLERGFQLNRIKTYIEEKATILSMTEEEKEELYLSLQDALDKKLLNSKIIQYSQEKEKIENIKDFTIKRDNGKLKWGFSYKKNNKKKITTTKKKVYTTIEEKKV